MPISFAALDQTSQSVPQQYNTLTLVFWWLSAEPSLVQDTFAALNARFTSAMLSVIAETESNVDPWQFAASQV